MNRSFLTVRMVLIMSLFFTQYMCGMKRFYQFIYGEKKFECLSQLPNDVQLLVIRYSAKDSDSKVDLQCVNKQWSEAVSIKNPKIFNVCCNIKHPHMLRIFLNAVYSSNYTGVENILSNSYFNKIKSPNLCYRNIYNNESGYEGVLDPYHIAREDRQMVQLLEKYNVATLPSGKVPCQPTPLIMACLAGNSVAINRDIKGDKNNIRKALNIIVACDYEKCMQQLMHNLSNEFKNLFYHDELRYVSVRKLLLRACFYNSCKVLRILLNVEFFDQNNIVNDLTLLDKILVSQKDDNRFDTVIALLKKYDAKTAQQIIQEKAAEAEERWYMPLAWQ